MEKEEFGEIIGLEIGGTNIKGYCLGSNINIFDYIKNLPEKVEIKEMKTDEPEKTVNNISNWILNELKCKNIKSIKMSMFGPLNITRNSEEYGKVLNTPKPRWKNFNIANALSEKLNIKRNNILIETDVNCAAYLEYKGGNHK